MDDKNITIVIEKDGNQATVPVGVDGKVRQLPRGKAVNVNEGELDVLRNSHVEFTVQGKTADKQGAAPDAEGMSDEDRENAKLDGRPELIETYGAGEEVAAEKAKKEAEQQAKDNAKKSDDGDKADDPAGDSAKQDDEPAQEETPKEGEEDEDPNADLNTTVANLKDIAKAEGVEIESDDNKASIQEKIKAGRAGKA